MDNLWTSLLRESSKRSKVLTDSKVLIVGDPECGKSSLLEKLCTTSNTLTPNSSSSMLNNDNSLLSMANGMHKNFPKTFVDYNFLEVDESLILDGGENVTTTPINVWSFDPQSYGGQFDFANGLNKQDKVIFAIILDMSKPANTCVQSLKKWLKFVNYKCYQLAEKFGNEYVDEKRKIADVYNNVVKSYQAGNRKNILIPSDANGSSETKSDNRSSQTQALSIFGFPIVVIANKCDLLMNDKEDFQTIQRLKVFQGQLRYICLQAGASFICTALNRDIGISKLRKYIQHRLYPEMLVMDLALEDGTDNAFIPTGFDSPELISISTGFNPLDNNISADLDLEAAYIDEIALEFATSNAAPVSVQVELESEKDWLNSLQSFVNQVTASTSNPASSSGLQNLPRANSEYNIQSSNEGSGVPVSSTSSLGLRRSSMSTSLHNVDSQVMQSLASTSTSATGSTTGTSAMSRRLSTMSMGNASSNSASMAASLNISTNTSTPSQAESSASVTTTTLSSEAAAGATASIPAKTIVRKSRVSSVIINKEGDQDVDDFFKNLLAEKPKK